VSVRAPASGDSPAASAPAMPQAASSDRAIQPHLDDLARGHGVQRVNGLLLGHIAGRLPGEGCVDRAARQRQQTQNGAEQGGLARAIGTDEGEENARWDVQAHIVDHFLPAVGDGDVFAAYERIPVGHARPRIHVHRASLTLPTIRSINAR